MYFSVHTIQILSRFYKTDSEIKQTNSFLHTELKVLLRIDHCLAVSEPKGKSLYKSDKAVEPQWR